MEKSKLLRSWEEALHYLMSKVKPLKIALMLISMALIMIPKFVFETVGYNLEGSEIGASFGLVQLDKLKQNIKTRQENFVRQCKF